LTPDPPFSKTQKKILLNGGSTVVEHQPRHPEVVGLSLAVAAGTQGKEMAKTLEQDAFLFKSFLPFAFSQCHQQWLDSNPRLWDDKASFQPLCYHPWHTLL
jgi:hypothetical protein